MEQLAAKADVQARARAKAAELGSQARDTIQRGRAAVAARAGQADGQTEVQATGWLIPVAVASAGVSRVVPGPDRAARGGQPDPGRRLDRAQAGPRTGQGASAGGPPR
ncbi:MAG: hypothetical protein ACRDRJ_21000 [Streptosporangiaceae bacterium]